MRRIFIKQSVDDIAEEYANNLFSNAQKDCKPKEKLKKLRDNIKNNKRDKDWKKYYDYVDVIYKDYKNILMLHPDGKNGFEEYQKNNLGMLTFEELKSKKWKKGKNIKFYEAIVAAMRYEDVRSQEIIKYINKKEIGIKVCVYCNANYTVTVDVSGEGIKARYEIDHFLPKSRYPFLSTSFFNFQPSCPFCNRWKWKNESVFNLYTESATDDDIDPFTISLTPASISLYKISFDSNDLEIKIDSNEMKVVNGKNVKLIDNHEEVFHINDLYKSFKEEAEEILMTSFFNNRSYLDQMCSNILSNVVTFSDKDAFRLVYGFYLEEKNIHKRPLTKMKQDIAKQLGII